MQRRKFVVGLGSLAAGGAAAMGTGAFSRVRANRKLNVTVAGDENALLAFRLENDPNAEYAEISSDGTLKIDLTGALTGADSGVNNDAYTAIRDIFTITNLGTQAIYVGVKGSTLPDKNPSNSSNDKAIGFFSDDANDGAGLGVGEGYYSGSGLGLDQKGIKIGVGQTLNRCGLHVYTTERDGIPNGNVTFVAKTEDEINDF